MGELEQYVRNILVRSHYCPRRPRAAATGRTELIRVVLAGMLTADELLRRYCTLVYAQTGSYVETARRLGLDRRAARTKVDATWLAEWRADGDSVATARPHGFRRQKP